MTIENFEEFPFIFDLRIDGKTLVYPSFSLSTERGEVTVLKPDGTIRVIRRGKGPQPAPP